jgi:hypothetical protein
LKQFNTKLLIIYFLHILMGYQFAPNYVIWLDAGKQFQKAIIPVTDLAASDYHVRFVRPEAFFHRRRAQLGDHSFQYILLEEPIYREEESVSINLSPEMSEMDLGDPYFNQSISFYVQTYPHQMIPAGDYSDHIVIEVMEGTLSNPYSDVPLEIIRIPIKLKVRPEMEIIQHSVGRELDYFSLVKGVTLPVQVKSNVDAGLWIEASSLFDAPNLHQVSPRYEVVCELGTFIVDEGDRVMVSFVTSHSSIGTPVNISVRLLAPPNLTEPPKMKGHFYFYLMPIE